MNEEEFTEQVHALVGDDNERAVRVALAAVDLGQLGESPLLARLQEWLARPEKREEIAERFRREIGHVRGRWRDPMAIRGTERSLLLCAASREPARQAGWVALNAARVAPGVRGLGDFLAQVRERVAR